MGLIRMDSVRGMSHARAMANHWANHRTKRWAKHWLNQWLHPAGLGGMRSAVLLLTTFALTACGGGGSGSLGASVGATSPNPANAGTEIQVSISSAETGLTYDLKLWLPPGYSDAAASGATANSATTATTYTTPYTTIYATDCEYRYATLLQVAQQSATKFILVNICAMGSARRWVDFTMPGAAAYFRFLTRELIPYVESHYRASPTNRVLSGHSLSGEFALYALYMEDPAHRFFTSIISEECSCWYDANGFFSESLAVPIDMEQAMYAADPRLPVNLVMAGDTLSNEPHVAAVYATITSRHYASLRSIQPVYSLGHVPMDGPAFKDALDFVFAAH